MFGRGDACLLARDAAARTTPPLLDASPGITTIAEKP
jgi:hypothetical protein